MSSNTVGADSAGRKGNAADRGVGMISGGGDKLFCLVLSLLEI